MAAVRWIVFHHTGTGPSRPSVQSTAAYHAGPSPMQPPSICYHVYVEADGTAYLCHDLEEVTWHAGTGSTWSKSGVGGNNWLSVGICFSGENPTEAQIETMKRVAAEIDRLMGRRLARIGHKHVSPTECPGSRWEEWGPRL